MNRVPIINRDTCARPLDSKKHIIVPEIVPTDVAHIEVNGLYYSGKKKQHT